MTHLYVGLTPRFLLTGRPIVFGDTLEDADLALADSATQKFLVPSAPSPSSPEALVAPTPTEPQEVVSTGNEAAPTNPEPEAK